jgi:hypothetical protein
MPVPRALGQNPVVSVETDRAAPSAAPNNFWSDIQSAEFD